MAENRLRIIAVLALLTLFAGSIVFTVTGALQSTVDPLVWLLGGGVWVVAMTIAIVITVPAPSGTRLSLGIGAVVAGSILVDDTMALASIVAISLTLSWLIQHNFDVGHARTDGDLLADSVAMAVYVFLYTVAFDALGTTFTVGYSWMVVAAVAAAGLSWFIIRALVAAFVGLERTELAGRYLWLLALEDWAVVISLFAAGTLFGLTWRSEEHTSELQSH